MENKLYFYIFYSLKYNQFLENINHDFLSKYSFNKNKKKLLHSYLFSLNPEDILNQKGILYPKNINELAINAECFVKEYPFPKEVINFDSKLRLENYYTKNSKLFLIVFFYFKKTLEEIFTNSENFKKFYLDITIEYLIEEREKKQEVIIEENTNTNEKFKIRKTGISINRRRVTTLDKFSIYFLKKLELNFKLKKCDFNNIEELHTALKEIFKHSEIDINKLELSRILIEQKKITINSFENDINNGFVLTKEIIHKYKKILD